MSIVQFIPQNYLYIVRNLETTPIIVGVLAGPTLNAIGINTGLDAVDYYGEVHLPNGIVLFIRLVCLLQHTASQSQLQLFLI